MTGAVPSVDSLVAGAFGATLVIDLSNDRILAATAAAGDLLRDSRLEGTRFSEFVPGQLGQLIVFVDEVLHRGGAWTRRIPITARNGSALECELNGKVVTLERSKALLLQITDLAELDARAEAARAAKLYGGGLREWQRAQSFFSELEQQNQLILNAAGEGIYGVNADGKTTFVNRAAQEMLGWTSDDLLGQDIHSKIHHHHLNGDVYPSQECPIYQSFRFEEVNRIEDEGFWRKDGKPIRVEYVSTPIYEGKVLAGAVVIFRDITERWENERKLREAMEEVAALRDKLKGLGYDDVGENQLKDVFVRFKALADRKKEVYDDDIIALMQVVSGDAINERIKLKFLRVICGTEAPQSADINLTIDGVDHQHTATGDGPVDATFNAVKALFPTGARLELYQVSAVTEGTDAQATVSVRLSEDGRIATGQSSDTDTVVASAKAYITALNRLQVRKKSTPEVRYTDAS